MKVTRDVMTDLLPVYFSDETSEDTKRLMGECFRENPDFERIARRVVTPLEELRSAAPVLPEAEREKQDLDWVREQLFQRRLAFGLALLFTLTPFLTVYRDGHLVWNRRDVLVPGLNKLGWPVEMPKATMFVWARIPEQYRKLGSLEFSKKLLLGAKVAVSPGIGFGDQGDGHVRFSLIENEERTRQALRGIKHMFKAG